LPLTSIPPPAPPEQAASDQVSTFDVFTGAVAGTAARTILLACAATIFAVGDRTDILAERIKGAAAWVDT